ncbi:MAG TPA: response regulator [Isosphaeraceae bacterium]|nr:response regulator [Isosphaeraceae bacterium]
MEHKTILLVEDNPDDQELTRLAFAKHNLQNDLVIVNDGVEAIEYLFGNEGQEDPDPRSLPAVVLLDLKLPRMDGLEVLRRIRAHPHTRTLPVVVLTSSQEDHDVAASYSNGVNSYIRKPVNFVEFVEAVRQLGLYWLLLNVNPPSGADA